MDIQNTDDLIFVDLLRCTGCWSCSLACVVGNNLPDHTFYLTVRTLGSGEGIDKPRGSWPDLQMSWMPIYSKRCIKCKGRVKKGEDPYCVHNCPNKALYFSDEAVEKIEEARRNGRHIFELPFWEESKDHIVYASPEREII